MSQLYFFRHAQASYGKKNYDQLSDLGYEQSRHLGKYLVENNIHFDYIYVGPLQRHHQTLTEVQRAFDANGVRRPDPIEMKELEEHRGPEVLKRVLPLLKEEDELIGRWEEARNRDSSLFVKNGLLIFERAMELWATGQLAHHHPPEFLTWPSFREQVRVGFQRVLENHKEEKGLRIGMFTSGGTISAAMGHILGMAHDRDIIRLNGIVQNTSISEFLFSGDRVTLKRFNEVPHLGEEMRTFV